MATLAEATSFNLEGYKPVEPGNPQPRPAPPVKGAENLYRNPLSRCPLPPTSNSADALRQWGQSNDVPRMRTFMPPSSVEGGGSSASSGVVISGGSSGGGGSSTVVVPPAAKNASLTTTSLAPNAKFTGQLVVAKAAQLLALSANRACRVEFYGTPTAQSLDFSRPLDTPPPAGTVQNIIADIALDTSPFGWPFQNRVGVNGNSPQTTIFYVTVTNLGSVATAITISLLFVPMES